MNTLELSQIINDLTYYDTSMLINQLNNRQLKHLGNACTMKLKNRHIKKVIR